MQKRFLTLLKHGKIIKNESIHPLAWIVYTGAALFASSLVFHARHVQQTDKETHFATNTGKTAKEDEIRALEKL